MCRKHLSRYLWEWEVWSLWPRSNSLPHNFRSFSSWKKRIFSFLDGFKKRGVHWVAEKWSSAPAVSLFNNKIIYLTIFWAAAGPWKAYFPPFLFLCFEEKIWSWHRVIIKKLSYEREKKKVHHGAYKKVAHERVKNKIYAFNHLFFVFNFYSKF